MWIPQSLLFLFTINKDTVDALRLEAVGLRIANTILERELTASKIMSDWLRLEVNQLNAERVKLIERAYPGLQLPSPELVRSGKRPVEPFDIRAIFEDQSEPREADPFAN